MAYRAIAVQLEPIALRSFAEADRALVQDRVVAAVTADPHGYLDRYVAHPESFDGRYVSADLMKETIGDYAQSREARGRYNAVVHNAAAVLAAEQFRQRLADDRSPEQRDALFLTGVPGAGKTSNVLKSGELPATVRLVFEGQLVNPTTSIEKIGQALAAGLQPIIQVVHLKPETALDNTLTRFAEVGRGSGIGLMADIMAGLPAGLRTIEQAFGDQVLLRIVDVRDRSQVMNYSGWDQLPILASEGNRDQIYNRLEARLEARQRDGSVSHDGYEQARGRAPFAGYDRVAGQLAERDQGDGGRRDGPSADRQAAVVAPSRWASLSALPEVRQQRASLEQELALVVKDPKGALARLDALLAATPSQEHATAQQAAKDLPNQELRGSDRLLDFAGRAARREAAARLPAAQGAVTDYGQVIEANGQRLDQQARELTARASIEVPTLSPELEQLTRLGSGTTAFAALVNEADKTQLAADAERVLVAIERKLGPELLAPTGGGRTELAAQVGLTAGRLIELRQLHAQISRVQVSANLVPSLEQEQRRGPELDR